MVKHVLFVCLGNICRSPIAEAVFIHLVKERGLEESWSADSAAIGPWHVGNSPDPRAMSTLAAKKITYSHRARQLKRDDFNIYDYVFGMDQENIRDINVEKVKTKNSKTKVELLGSYDPEGELIIEDPYYEKGDAGFFKCYEQCVRSCNAFLDANK